MQNITICKTEEGLEKWDVHHKLRAFFLHPQASLQANGKAEENCFLWCYFDPGLKSPLKVIGISTGRTATDISFTHNQSCIVSHVVCQAVRHQHAVGHLAQSVPLHSAQGVKQQGFSGARLRQLIDAQLYK